MDEKIIIEKSGLRRRRRRSTKKPQSKYACELKNRSFP
jgi:hypothetical protein